MQNSKCKIQNAEFKMQNYNAKIIVAIASIG